MIDTREELVNALTEAAELEHGLLVQYMFAAFSMKRRTDEGITPVQQALLVDWERAILSVAHEEMTHLGTVCNLLSAIGAAPQFSRPSFPQPAQEYYPFDFQLERFNDSSLYRFIVFELPEDEEAPSPPEHDSLFETMMLAAPDPLVYNHVGELYRQIADGFANIREAELFIGPKPLQDDDWARGFAIPRVVDLISARAAIQVIIEEGEGATETREGSHYDKFLKTREALRLEREKDQDFDPARPVVLNPQTREHRDAAGNVTLIENELTREVGELFNDVYSTMLLMLIQYYGYGGESNSQRKALRDSSRRMMSAIVRPVAEVLTELPISSDPTDGNAGPGFEIYSGLRLAPDRNNRWTVLRERLVQNAAQAKQLTKYQRESPALQRLERVGLALDWTTENLAKDFEQVY